MFELLESEESEPHAVASQPHPVHPHRQVLLLWRARRIRRKAKAVTNDMMAQADMLENSASLSNWALVISYTMLPPATNLLFSTFSCETVCVAPSTYTRGHTDTPTLAYARMRIHTYARGCARAHTLTHSHTYGTQSTFVHPFVRMIQFEDGTQTLRADRYLSCQANAWTFMAGYSVVFAVLWLAIPVRRHGVFRSLPPNQP